MAEGSISYTMTPVAEDAPPSACAACGAPARVMVTPEGGGDFATLPCCGAGLCQFQVCVALIGQAEPEE